VRHDNLGNTSRVGERSIEHTDSLLSSKFKIDLIGSNAETTNCQKLLGVTQDLFGKLGLASNPNDMYFFDNFNKLFLCDLGSSLYLHKITWIFLRNYIETFSLEALHSILMHAFQQKHFDFGLGE
jgi:hypothetical protein